MNVTDSGIVSDVNEVQFKKAYAAMEVIPFGIVIDDNEVQLQNAYSPMEVTLAGTDTDFKL